MNTNLTPTPTVAIVGRPNVGKSTLFNRLLRRRQAIVHNQPGVTRDRIVGIAELEDDRSVQLIDTGGLVPGDDPLGLGDQVDLAVEESDLLIMVVDGRAGLTSADERVWEHLRRQGKPTVLAVNKGDTLEAQDRWSEFYRLGVDEPILVSAEHGTGVGILAEAVLAKLPEAPAPPSIDAPPIAIVGRPNVGKSSLVNKISGEYRTLVSPVAGTTRDPIDTVVTRDGTDYLLIDTAGIRRRAKTVDQPEDLAVMMARRQIERAEVCILVIDASAGVTSGDLTIAGTIGDLGRSAIVAVNKWDLLDEESREELEKDWPRLVQILASPQRVNVSALSGRAIDKLFPALDRVLEQHRTRLTTGEINRMFEEMTRRRKPPAGKGRPWRMYYATQVGTGPPTFMLFANRTLSRNDHYRRYLVNRLREGLGLEGVPVRLVIRKR